MKTKRILISILLIMCLLATACGKKQDVEQGQNKETKVDVAEDKQSEGNKEDDEKEEADETDKSDKSDENNEAVEDTINLDEYNNFVSETYSDLFNNYIADTKNVNLIYSPYGFIQTLRFLSCITDDYNNDEYYSKLINMPVPEEPKIVRVSYDLLLNEKKYETDDRELLKKVKIKSLSPYKGQTEEPDIVLRTYVDRAAGYLRGFDSDALIKDIKFKPLTPFKNELIGQELFTKGFLENEIYEDELATVGRQALTADNSYVYFINPKNLELNTLKEIAKNIPQYISNYESGSNNKTFDNVKVIKLLYEFGYSSSIIRMQQRLGHDNINIVHNIKDNITTINETSKISEFSQRRVEMPSTSSKEEMSKLERKYDNEFVMDLSTPYFAISVENGVIVNILFFGYCNE